MAESNVVHFSQEELVPINYFLPRLIAPLDGIDPNMAATYLIDTAIEISERAKIWRETMCFEALCGVDSYKIELPEAVIHEVASCQLVYPATSYRGHEIKRPIVDSYVDNNTLYVQNNAMGDGPLTPLRPAKIELSVYLKPNRDSSNLPKSFYQDYLQAMIDGALHRVYLIRNAKWYSLTMSREHLDKFDEEVNRLISYKARKHRPITPKLRPKRIM